MKRICQNDVVNSNLSELSKIDCHTFTITDQSNKMIIGMVNNLLQAIVIMVDYNSNNENDKFLEGISAIFYYE